MALAAIDEAIRNVVAVGADPSRIALLDNFCWPSVDDEKTMGTLVRACEACRDAALAYGIPFISGKDSLHNQFTNSETGEVIRIPNTLLISAIGVIDDVRKCVTMDLKQPGMAPVYLVAAHDAGGLTALAATHRAMAQLIAEGRIVAAHDLSDGGLLVAAAEMCIASGFGLNIDADVLASQDPFIEQPGRYLVEAADVELDGDIAGRFDSVAAVTRLGFVQHRPSLLITQRSRSGGMDLVEELPVEELSRAWRGTLDW
jgi:phosphoribosylformylglycinamidine synthase subunit PurSL